MPVKLLLPLRLFNPSLPVARITMKCGPSFTASRAMPIFPSIFPFKLKYLVLNGQVGVRRLSTRPFRPRAAGSSSEFTHRRGGGEKLSGSKSLIDDEAELSDWVGELRESNFESERPSQNRFGNRDGGDRDRVSSKFGRPSLNGGERDRERGSKFGRPPPSGEMGRERVNKFDRQSVSVKRRRDRESDADEFSEPKRSSTLTSRVGQRFGEKFDDSRRRSNFRENTNVFKGKTSLGPNKRERVLLSEDDFGDVSGEDKKKGLRSGIEELLSEEDGESSNLDFNSGSDDDDNDSVLRKKASAALGLEKRVSVGSSTETPNSYLSETRFDQYTLSPLSLKGIQDAGYQTMTVVQAATLPAILKGKDVMAKAKTGTGKTVAFLLPSVEVVVKSPPVGRDQRQPPFQVLVICPTRELASQAAAEAKNLLKYHTSIGVQVVIGGTRLALEQKKMQANPCQILVATPGRLRDHTENTSGFATRLMGVKVLVLDEADHLLDMGFRKDIEKIIAAVPKQRQTLLFSATIPDEVRQICHIALKRDHEYINTVEEGSEETHAQVRQTHLVAPLDNHFPFLYALLKEHIADDVNYKVLVFCTTAKVTGLVAQLLGELNLNVREIHSRKPQSYRTRVSDEFRKSKGLILVTSDVSARGVDYPDVTLVIQVGLPSDRQQYIHRLGRTGRKGKEGQGILLLAPWEEFFLRDVKDLPITKAHVPTVDPDTKKKVQKALSNVEMKTKEGAYQAWLGYYNSNKTVARDKIRLVELANDFSRSMGLDNPPAIPKNVLGKMGLKNVPGLRSK